MSEGLYRGIKPEIRQVVDRVDMETYQALLTRFGELVYAIEHVINDSPGTPDSVKQYLRQVLRGRLEA